VLFSPNPFPFSCSGQARFQVFSSNHTDGACSWSAGSWSTSIRGPRAGELQPSSNGGREESLSVVSLCDHDTWQRTGKSRNSEFTGVNGLPILRSKNMENGREACKETWKPRKPQVPTRQRRTTQLCCLPTHAMDPHAILPSRVGPD
jgi:hypothetical protein